jgi:hypothetical protein
MPVNQKEKASARLALSLDDYVPPRGDFIPAGEFAPHAESTQTPLLLQPVIIGPLRLKNRSVVSPMSVPSSTSGFYWKDEKTY